MKKKGFTEGRVATMGLYDIGTSTTLESNKSLAEMFNFTQISAGHGTKPANADMGEFPIHITGPIILRP